MPDHGLLIVLKVSGSIGAQTRAVAGATAAPACVR